MTSSKKLIFETLKRINKMPVSYGFSDSQTFPKIVFFHVTTYHKRLSNVKMTKHHLYQINVYDTKPHDIETSEVLSEIEDRFENLIFNTGDWQEVINISENGQHEYMYYIEVHV